MKQAKSQTFLLHWCGFFKGHVECLLKSLAINPATTSSPGIVSFH